MKNINYIFYVGLLAISAANFAACSDEETFDFPGDPYNHVYIQDNSRTFTIVHAPVSSISTLDFKLPLYCNHRVTSAFSVKVEVDNSLVAAYNEKNDTEYAEIPVSALVIENAVIRFEEGGFSSADALHITMNEAVGELRNANGYLIPIKIVSVEDGECKMVENMSTTYIVVNVKEDPDNIYDDAVDQSVKGALVSDRSGWMAIVPEGSTYNPSYYGQPEDMFSEGNTYWYGRTVNTREELPVIINLGKSYLFDGITASYLSNNVSGSWTNKSKIEISSDGTIWKEVGMLSNTNIIQVFYAPVTAQYIKITVPAPTSNSRVTFRCGNFNIYAK